MAFYDQVWYANAGNQSTTGYYAVTVRPQNIAVAAGVLRRQFTAPAVGSERVFVCIVAGTTANVTDATWVLTRGAKTTDGTVTWQECTGASAVNGDQVNTVNWTAAKAIGTPTLGAIIQRNNGASYWICSTAGTLGASEPAWSNNTAGTTQADGTTTWTCLGVVGNFSGGGAPFARLASASVSTWFAAGNTIYVGNNHAESQTTAIAITPVGSTATFSKIICHNNSGSYPPASTDITTGGTIATTSASTNLTFNPTGMIYVYGLTLKAGVGVSTAVNSILLTPASGGYVYFDNCSFWLSNSTASNTSQMQINASGAAATAMIFNNVTVRYAAATQILTTGNGVFIWQNTGPILASGSTVPNNLFSFAGASAGTACQIILEALDLSQLTGGLYLAVTAVTNLLVKDCALNASMTAATPSVLGAIAQFVRSDDVATAYQSSRYTLDGTETTETSIVRTGGAVDAAGQAQSRKIVTTANVQWLRPFKAEPYAIWSTVTGANVTVTVYGTINSASLPLNDDIWMEVEYLGSSSTPLGTIVTTTKSNLLASNAAVSSDSSSWGAPAANYATLDGTPGNATLSNGNLTATHSNTTSNSGARSTLLQTAGKFYFEATFTTTHGSFDSVGIITSAGSYLNLGNGLNCTAAYAATVIASNGGATAASVNFSSGNVIGVAIDLDNRLGWFRNGNGNWNSDPTANPQSATGGVTIAATVGFEPVVGFSGTGTATNDNVTLNFGATSFAHTAPAGFDPWVTSSGSWSPFKLTATLSSPQPGLAGYLYARVRAAKASSTWYIDPKIVLT